MIRLKVVERIDNFAFTARREVRIFLHLGWRDLKSRYADTFLGPWWSVANLLVIVIGSTVAVNLLSGGDIWSSAGNLALGISLWTLMANNIIESTEMFISERSLLLNTHLSELSLILRIAWRNLLVYFHNLSVVGIIVIISGIDGLYRLCYLPVLGIVATILVLPISIVVARLSIRLPAIKIVAPAIIQFLFFLTPILWKQPTSGAMALVGSFNPFAWVINISKTFVFNEQINVVQSISLLSWLLVAVLSAIFAKHIFRYSRKSI